MMQLPVMGGFGSPLATAVIALAVSWIVTPYVMKFAIAKGAMDDPKADDRRVHTEPIPRWGGIAIYVGFVVSLLAVLPFAFPNPSATLHSGWPRIAAELSRAFPLYLVGIIFLGGLVVVVGALDDIKNFSAKKQLLFLLGVGLVIQLFKVQIGSLGVPFADPPRPLIVFGLWSIPITAFYVFVVGKTMDTIDGLDGLAAGISAIAASTLVIIAAGHQPRVAIIAAALAGSALGFLRHNFNPAKIFMGTGGAQFLGFTLAVLSIIGAFKMLAALAILVPVLAFGVPIFDAAFVITRRVLHRQPITQADKRHMHHTLIGMGLSQRQAVLVLYALAAALSGTLLIVVLRRNG